LFLTASGDFLGRFLTYCNVLGGEYIAELIFLGDCFGPLVGASKSGCFKRSCFSFTG